MNRDRLLLGLTGLYCAGKNFVGGILEKKGFAVLDVDKLGHTALVNQKNAIVERFTSAVLGPDGAVDRRALGKSVFGKPEELALLESIVHPEVNDLTLKWLAANSALPRVINAALLHRSVVFDRLDALVIVKAPRPLRMFRARKRDGLSWKELRRRFESQHFDIYYSAKKADTYYIYNWGFGIFSRLNRHGLEKQVDMILNILRG
ncbi:MAG: dephospho-CoA kinase [Spirochaetaceae bacterium]|jgi:dephospho-CoA kinase|nr:dephospho-CoA kinase [Spirochaetaceae bacterium]